MPLYGATAGIMAQEESNRQALKSGLDAQLQMGKIAAIPSMLKDAAAVAELHQGQADEQAQQNKSAAKMQELYQSWQDGRRETEARKQVSLAGEAAGKIVTVADLPKKGLITQASQADDLEAFAEFASSSLPPTALAEVRKQIADIRQKEAAAGASNARASETQYKEVVARAEQLGNLAGAAAGSEANYNAIMLGPQRAMLPPQLTGNYRLDLPMLRAIEQASQNSIQRVELEQKTLTERSRRGLIKAQTNRAEAGTTKLEAEKKQIKFDYDQAVKTGGKYSPEAVRLKRLQGDNLESLIKARNAQKFPDAPLDPEMREYDKVYTAKDGKTHAVWTHDPTTGKGVWMAYSGNEPDTLEDTGAESYDTEEE